MKRLRIIICRHAESLEDIDNNIYDTIKDLDIPLTPKGEMQASRLGAALAEILGDSSEIRFFTSPGLRNKQSLNLVLPHLPQGLNYCVDVEPLLVKQDWGDINSKNRSIIEDERYRIGVLRYKFPTGESAEHLIERLTTFKERIFQLQNNESCDVVLLSHGFEFRVLLMLILGWTEEYFESLGNLNNGEFRILTRDTNGVYELNEQLRKHGLPITRLLQSP